jgi:trigger factor
MMEERSLMKVAMHTEPGSRAVLEIEVPEDVVARAMDQAYAALVRQVNVPGFRRGKAPRSILERHLGANAIREEALRRLIPEQYSEAVTQSGISPIASPSVDIHDADDGKGLRLTATVDVYPEIKLPDYHAIHVDRESNAVGEGDVDRALEDIRARQGRLVTVGEPAARGDYVLLHVSSAPAGLERVQPGKELLVEVGGGLLPAEVEAALEGSRAGDERSATLTSGQGDVSVRVADVRRKELPPLDDEFAKKVSDQTSLAGLRAGLRAQLDRERTERETSALQDRVVDAVLAQTTMELPESLVEHEIDHVVEDVTGRLQSRGMTLDSYLRSVDKDEVTFRGELRPRAERRVRVRVLLEAVTEREGLTISEEEMADEVKKLAAELQQDIPSVEKWLDEGSRRDGLRAGLLRRKAVDTLVGMVAGPEPAQPAGASPEETAGAPPVSG